MAEGPECPRAARLHVTAFPPEKLRAFKLAPTAVTPDENTVRGGRPAARAVRGIKRSIPVASGWGVGVWGVEVSGLFFFGSA